ncbi:WEE protein kinase [Saprolegnia parasitica CBS 223.65]|uniref:WEE protein kinase n=1 Tax=Saprolegnia parasitica (strain CBS 223.65) TaxID=695850 RepID=A0A067CNB4_SAPPC|nr:WEE protein kinase [Saprolegnia parasitica CBS 223.65]KDO32013.1 WEE protein kinase [Saprolegnia parasitica CBS 223.65]|eukprot:XP_012197403.1 WEE protein kinase [Saprolegnia parasitica CBS 223.65]
MERSPTRVPLATNMGAFETPLPKRHHIHRSGSPVRSKLRFDDLSPVPMLPLSPTASPAWATPGSPRVRASPSMKSEGGVCMNLSSQFDDISDDSEAETTVADHSRLNLDTSALAHEVLSDDASSSAQPRKSLRRALHRSSRCPPTPMRTPPWAKKLTPIRGSLHRQSSLASTKVLVTLGGTVDHVPVQTSYFESFQSATWIGAGAFSDVYHVTTLAGDAFAVKKSKLPLRSKRDRERMLQEIQVYEKLTTSAPTSPYLVQYYQAWQERGFFYMQLELCAAGTLQDYIDHLRGEATKVPEAVLWHILHDVASGLAVIHAHKIVHLDIKPANLFVTTAGSIKIGDFGVATAVDGASDGEGDQRYMAPELLANAATRAASADIFSLGMTLLELSHLVHPLPQDGPAWHALREETLPTLPYSAAWTQLLYQMLRTDPDGRISAAQITERPELSQLARSDDLASFGARVRCTSLSPPTSPPASPPPSPPAARSMLPHAAGSRRHA